MQVSTRAAVHSEVMDQHRDRGELALRADSDAQTSSDGSGPDRAEARVPRPAVARRGEDELGPEQSARRLRIHRRELGYLVEAGLLTPTSCTPSGGPRFAATALDAVSTRPLDWESARAADKRLPSPWRELAGPEAERAALVATACERLRADGVNAWAQHSRVADRWTLDWEPGRFGGPEPGDVARLLPPRLLRAIAGRQLVLLGPVGQTLHWAHRMLQPGRACVLDVETTGLGPDDRVVEIAVVDAHDGAVLIDTLVHPGAGVRNSREARAVHGITDAMVAEAEPWEQVLPRVLAAIEGRTVLAYNSPFDKRMTVGHARAVGADPGRLALEASWECLMRRRSRWLRTTSRRRLGGRHRARGDALAALEVLRQLRTRPPHTGAD